MCGVIFAKIRTRAPKIDHSDFDLDVVESSEGLELVAILTCEPCQTVTRFTGPVLKPGAALYCPCGESAGRLPVEDFDEVKASLMELNASLKNLTVRSNSDDESDG